MFYGKRRETAVVSVNPDISDDDDEEEDDDVSDPDFVPPSHNQDIPGPSDMGPSTSIQHFCYQHFLLLALLLCSKSDAQMFK